MSWKADLHAALGANVTSAEPVSGGDINDAYCVTLDDQGLVFVKTHDSPPPGMYEAEAAGLDWLRGTLRVPKVLAHGPRFIALEWLDIGPKGGRFDESLGRGLALLHKRGAPCFGLDRANYLATIPQDNTPSEDGARFWIEQRLRPLAEKAIAAGSMSPEVRAMLDKLPHDRFPDEPPARLHGDLWWGNVVACRGEPAIIDPAVYGGHREVDLAMLALFGGVSSALVDAYSEAFPLASGWRDRISLWQLYPVAAHAVLFGGGYGAQFQRTLAAML